MVVSILIGIFIYNLSVKVITDEVNQVHYASLNQLKMIMDTKQNEIESIGTRLLVNETIRRTMEIRDSLTPSQGYSLVEIQKELIEYKVSNNFIENIYIYFRYNDFVLSDKSKYNAEKISDITRLYFNMEKEEWLDYINISGYNKCKILKIETEDGEKINKLIYIQSLNHRNFGPSHATLVITFDTDNIIESIANSV